MGEEQEDWLLLWLHPGRAYRGSGGSTWQLEQYQLMMVREGCRICKCSAVQRSGTYQGGLLKPTGNAALVKRTEVFFGCQCRRLGLRMDTHTLCLKQYWPKMALHWRRGGRQVR